MITMYVRDILAKGLLDNSKVCTYDNDSILFIADRQSFSKRGKEEFDCLERFYDRDLSASILKGTEKYEYTQPYFLVYYNVNEGGDTGEIHTGLYDTKHHEIISLFYLCGNDDEAWDDLYIFFNNRLTTN